MRRYTLLAGIVVLNAMFFGWNYLSSVPVDQLPDGDLVVTSGNHLPIWLWLLAIVVWYGICWVNIVNEWERRPVLLFGRYVKTLNRGLNLLEPIVYTTLPDVPVRDLVTEVNVPQVQTKDNVGMSLIGVLTYRIDEDRVRDSVVEVENIHAAIEKRAFSTLSDTAGTNDMDQLLEHRENFCSIILNKIGERTKPWGVRTIAFELKAVTILDEKIAEAIAMKARASKEAGAELVRAEMQTQIATALNTAATTYTADGRWLKGIEVLIEMCRSGQNNTILIPTELTETLGHLKSMLPAPVDQ